MTDKATATPLIASKCCTLDTVDMLLDHHASLSFPPTGDRADTLLLASPTAMHEWAAACDAPGGSAYSALWAAQLRTFGIVMEKAGLARRVAVFYVAAGGGVTTPRGCILVSSPAHDGAAVAVAASHGVSPRLTYALVRHVVRPDHQVRAAVSHESAAADAYLVAGGATDADILCHAYNTISRYDATPHALSLLFDECAHMLNALLDHTMEIFIRGVHPVVHDMEACVVRGEMARAWAARVLADPTLVARDCIFVLSPDVISESLGRVPAAHFAAVADATTRNTDKSVRVFFVLNKSGGHWSLLVYYARLHTFLHIDSFGNGVLHDAYAEEVANAFISAIEGDIPPCRFQTTRFAPNAQQRSNDCGLYMLAAAQLAMSRREPVRDEDTEAMFYWCGVARVQLAALSIRCACAEASALIGACLSA